MKINITALTLTACLLAGCGRREEKTVDKASTVSVDPSGRISFPPDSPKLREIRVQPVVPAKIPIAETDAPGQIEVNPNRIARVTIPVTGRVASVNVKIGGQVRQGETLLLMESSDSDTALSTDLQAQASLTLTQTSLTKAEADYERSKDLFAREAVAKKDVLAAEANLAQARAAVDAARAVRLQSQGRLDLLGLRQGVPRQRVAVHAPISGRVLEMSVVPGEFRNDATSPLMTIADLSTVQVVSDVPETYIRFIQVGEPIEVNLSAYPDEKLTARVSRIAETVDPNTRTVKVFADLPNPAGRFRPDMFGRIRHVEGLRDTPAVPPSALVQSGEQTLVYREVSPGVFQPLRVKTGVRIAGLVGITDGISSGDRVVIDGTMLLKAN